MKKGVVLLAALALLAHGIALTSVGVLAQQAPTPTQAEFFEKSIRPVLSESCLGCHDGTAAGGLRLDSREALLKGGKTGPAIVPGDPAQSLLIAAVAHTGGVKMPLGGARLADEKIAALTAWVKDGALWPDGSTGGKPEAVLREHFETHIRPVLAQQCFACHTAQVSGGLRLDSREDALKGGKTGPAVVPGDPDKSIIIAALRHSGTLRMPKGGTRLTDEQIAFFVQWIKDGAFWPADTVNRKEYSLEQKHLWSVQPLASHPVPAVKDAAWPLNDIDRFVLARLEKEGMKPTTGATRRDLIRRVTYDLTGLMPAMADVQAFEHDKSPNAWEKVVDRLLASPQYGERWARHWMDVVRYGEDDYNVGGRPDRTEKYPFAYLYRDWLIRAFNDDMTYDMFVKTQLAADLMDDKVRDTHLPALGMNGNGIWIFQASPAPIERADEWHDKVDVTSKAFLGLTVGCARCHDHKYDAIYARDYYGMASIFASSNFKSYPRVPKAVADEYEKQSKVLEKKQEELKKFQEEAGALYAKVLLSQAEDYMVAAWKLGSDRKASIESIAEDTKTDPEILGRWVKFLKKRPDNYPALKTWQEMVSLGGSEDEARTLAKEFVAKVKEVDEKHAKLAKDNEALLASIKDEKEPFDPLPNGKKRRLNNYQIDLKSLDREDLLLWRDVFERDVPEATAETDDEMGLGGRGGKPGLLKLSDGALERRLPADLRMHLTKLKADADDYKKQMMPRPPAIYGIAEAENPSDLRVFTRGNPYTFGEPAPRAIPSILNGGEPRLLTKGSGRLELAEEIVRHPVAQRVIVNRVWRWHFGRGIVDSPSNFGTAGEKPTHPELLDFLAAKFVKDGMSFKKLHKDILLSRTYQMSTAPVAANIQKDASNTLFWRANRQRIDSEGVWDLLLQAADKLDMKTQGGPSEELSDKMQRRAVYAKVSRMYPHDFHATFDLPAATISTEKRYTTNVPQQRLFFLNSSMVRNLSDALAESIKTLESPEAQVRKAYEVVFQRVPTAEELSLATAFVQKSPLKALPPAPAPEPGRKADKDAPKPLPDSPLRSFCWALVSSNEFLFIE
ncbi:MAG: PSD1 and planctomycete cytochrome C domain-containing protein [Vicinamibacterales bacterium]